MESRRCCRINEYSRNIFQTIRNRTCLTLLDGLTSRVGFLQDRKMVVHMMEDIKELLGMTPSQPSVPKRLVGPAAEEAGLWVVALTTLVKLVSFSCRHQTTELVEDFEAAEGFEVLQDGPFKLVLLPSQTFVHGQMPRAKVPSSVSNCSMRVAWKFVPPSFVKLLTSFVTSCKSARCIVSLVVV